MAIDPGTHKCGLAVLNDHGTVLEKLVIPIESLSTIIPDLNQKYRLAMIVIGDRTSSRSIRDRLSFLRIPMETVDENNSSMEGRFRYLRENTTGLSRLIPIGLRTPKYPYDDYVAVILGERFLKMVKREEPL